MSKQDENSEEKAKTNKKEETPKQTQVKVEAPKTRLITAFVMLSGSAFVAIYTYFQHYEIRDWLITLFIGAVVFLVAGLLLEWLVTHFSSLIQDRDDAISAQEDAIAARHADELAAEKAREEALLAEAENDEEQTNIPNTDTSFGESDEFGGIEDTSGF